MIINLNRLVLYIYFLCFGFYGALTPSFEIFRVNTVYHIVFEIIILSIPLIFNLITKNSENNVSLKFKPKFFLFVIILIIFALSFFELFPVQYQLYSDEQSFVLSAHAHSIEVIKKLKNYILFINDIQLTTAIRLLSLLSILFLCATFYLFQILNINKMIFIFLLILLIFRGIIAYFGGFMSPHPSGNLIIPFISGAVFGFSPLYFKLAIMVIYTIFISCLIEKYFHQSVWIKILLLITILTFPVIIELKHTLEPSIWTSMIFTFVGILILTEKKINFNNIIICITLFSFLRQPSFFSIILIFLIHLSQTRILFNKEFVLDFLKPYASILLFFPYLINSLFLGTTSTKSLLKSPYDFEFQRGEFNFYELFNSINLHIPEIYIFYFILFFVMLLRFNLKYFFIFLIFLFILIYIYYSIDRGLWGLAKYQAEYFIPFVTFSIIVMFKYFKAISPLYLTLIAASNLYYNLNIFALNEVFKGNESLYKTKYEFGLRYNVSPVIREIININELENVVYLGVSYKFYQFVPESIKVVEYFKVLNLNSNLEYFVKNKNSKIRYVNNSFINKNYIILADTPNQDIKRRLLLKNGWKIIKEEKNLRHKSRVFLFKKSLNK